MALGYPECCAAFFQKYHQEQEKKNNDYVLPTLKESQGFAFPFQTNVAVRFLDLTLLNHFPCNFNCRKSIEIANKNLGIIGKHSAELRNILEGMLKGAVLYTETQGIFALRYASLKGNNLSFQGMMASESNEIYGQIKNSALITIVDKNKIIIKGREISNIGFMLFA